ncbi:MAG: hypothetical protein WKF97_00800 [Chitinophagaceae bacterium]
MTSYDIKVLEAISLALSIEMLDLKGAAGNRDTIRPVSTALARGTGVFNEDNAHTQVQAFSGRLNTYILHITSHT